MAIVAGAAAHWHSNARRRHPALRCRGILGRWYLLGSASRVSLKSSWRDFLFAKNSEKEATSWQTAPSLLRALQDIYTKRMAALENRVHFTRCYEMTELTESYFNSKPLVLVLGQYSTGKSTMIAKLLGSEYPGVRIGPEPTTDKFVVVSDGPSRRLIPGFALCSDPSKPFGQLQRFGSRFLERFEGAVLPQEDAPLLGSLSFVDTPGVLSGDKQRVGRAYDFEGAVSWFAENADMVIVMFDPNKLDVSDEFRRCLQALSSSERKIRFVLNKADALDTSELIRVYGALMWSLSKVIDTPEMAHAFIGSFNKEPPRKSTPTDIQAFFKKEENRLLEDIAQVPSDCTTRKVNDLLRRGRLLRAHALLVHYLAESNSGIFRKVGAVRKMIADPQALASACKEVSRVHGIPMSDYPVATELGEKLAQLPDSAFRRVPAGELANAEQALTEDIPALMEWLTAERMQKASMAEAVTLPVAVPPSSTEAEAAKVSTAKPQAPPATKAK